MQTVEELCSQFPRSGRVDWIGYAEKRRGDIQVVSEVEVRADTGIVGEHHANSGNSKRQVTLIQAEHLPVVAALLGKSEIDPARVRRNIVVSGLPLIALKEKQFRIGDALLEGTGPCDPCSLMEYTLGPGGYNAMRGHGGLCAIVLEPGTIRVGDPVSASEK